MFVVEPKEPPWRTRRWFPGLLAWLIGTPVGVVLGCAGIVAFVSADLEHRAVPVLRVVLEAQGHHLSVLAGTISVGKDPLGCLRVEAQDVVLFGATPYAPTVWVEGIEVLAPRLVRHDGRWSVQMAEVRLTDVTVLVARRKRPKDWTAYRSWLSRVEVGRVAVDGLELLLPQDGHMTEVLLTASAAEVWAMTYSPGDRALHGEGSVASTEITVAGVDFHGVHASVLGFDGDGMDVRAAGRLGALPLRASLRLSPLFRPPKVWVQAHVDRGQLRDLSHALLGEDAPMVDGVMSLSGDLEAGHHLGPGALRGQASVDLAGVAFTVPNDAKPGLLLAGRLLPFLRVTDRTIQFGELVGEVSYTQAGVTFDEVTYDAPHSVAEVAGYVRGDGLSAMMHFRPKPHSGAIGWGFVVHGALRHPKVTLASAPLLNHWSPCDDPLDCGVRGGRAKDSEGDDQDEVVVAKVRRQKLAKATSILDDGVPPLPPHERHAARTQHPVLRWRPSPREQVE